MKRILYVTDYLFAGGVESQLVELVLRLDRDRFQPHVVCLYGPRARGLHFAPTLQRANVPLHLLDLQLSPQDKIRGLARIARLVHTVNPDVIHAVNYHANLLTRLARPFYPRVKLIGTVRGVYTAKQLLYERLGHRMATRVVVNAGHLKTMLEQLSGIPPHKIVTIPNGVDTERFSTPQNDTLRQDVAPGARRLLVTVGRISHEKNIHTTVQALGLLKCTNRLPSGTRFLIVGPVHEEEAQKQLEKAIQQDSLEEVVIQHQDTRQPENYYHAGDVTVLYSPAEGLPNVALESLAAGRPVVISEIANAAKIIESGVTGWVVPNDDVKALADTLHHVLTLPDSDLASMRTNCINAAKAFTMERMVDQYMALYETL